MSVQADFLRTNSLMRPLGIDTPHPEFSWRLSSSLNDVLQTGYTLQVATDDRFDDLVWDSGRCRSSTPFGVRYQGGALCSMRRYWWRVRVWTTVASADETAGDWSEPSWFETAILDPSLWSATWIGGAQPESKHDDAVLYVRGDVNLGAQVVRARAYVSALGWYRFFVNGTDLTGHALVPRWTPYDRAVEYQTYDITDALNQGDNIVAMAVGDGRFRGALGLLGSRNSYGTQVAAYAQIVVDVADGSSITAVTDKHWKAGGGRITGSDPKYGERADLRIVDDDWLRHPVAPSRFAQAKVLANQAHSLIAEEVARVHDVQRLRATVHRSPSGSQILDFGQNFAGVTRIRLSGPAGRSVQLTHSEMLTPQGELDTDAMVASSPKKWFQRETVVLSGQEEWYEPWFTIHGFRYVEVTGLDADVDPGDVEGIVLSTDLTYSSFESSDPRLDRLYANVVWSMRSNFTDTPTDCPTRERAGWTGDIQVFGPTAVVLADTQAYLRRYLRNLALEQYPDGAVPNFVPSEHPTRDSFGRRLAHIVARSVGWSDVSVLLPWTLYQHYGDQAVLERQYDSMAAWIEHQVRAATRSGRGRPLATIFDRNARTAEPFILDSGFHFGEWLRPGEKPLKLLARAALRPNAAVTTAYFAYVTGIFAQIAEILGRLDDQERYQHLAIDIGTAWRTVFVHEDGRIGGDRQDDYVRALAFGLLLPGQRAHAVRRLVQLIEEADHHLDTGFLSTPMLLDVLMTNSRPDVAMRLLLQTTNPSWLYPVERGATTVWETWEGYDEDGRGKESHNHYALGSVAGWLIQGLAGLSAEPGWRTVRFAPLITPDIADVAAAVDTPYGEVRGAWKRHGDQVEVDVTIPAGAAVEIHSPDGIIRAGSGHHRLTWMWMASAPS